MIDISSNLLKQDVGFQVHFHFKKNTYFTNEILSVTLTVPGYPTNDAIESIRVTEIHWNENQTVVEKIEKYGGFKIPGKKNKKIKRIIRQRESFFRNFMQEEIRDNATASDALAKMCFSLREEVMFIIVFHVVRNKLIFSILSSQT